MIKMNPNREKPNFEDLMKDVEQETGTTILLNKETEYAKKLTDTLKIENKKAENWHGALVDLLCKMYDACNDLNEHRIGIDKISQNIDISIADAKKTKLIVGINDEGKQQIEERNTAAINTMAELLTTHEQRMQSMLDNQAKHLDRISIPPMLAYIMLTTTAVFLIGFTILITLNITQLHHETLSNTLWLIAGMLILFNALVIGTTIWLRNRNL